MKTETSVKINVLLEWKLSFKIFASEIQSCTALQNIYFDFQIKFLNLYYIMQ